MKTFRIFILMMTVLSFSKTFAQASDVKAQLVADWERAKAFTKEYLDAMPEDGINYKPSPEMRSFAEQMLHLTQGNIGLSGNGTAKARIYDGVNLEKSEQYKNKAALTAIVLEGYDFVIDGVKNMDFSKSGEIVKRGTFEVTKLGWVMKAFEHQTHHRGQCTVYFRTKGLTPPNEKLF